MVLKGMPWVADEMKRVVECLQGEHGIGAQEESAWALKPPTNSEGKVWAIARIGLTSPVKKVAEARLECLSWQRPNKSLTAANWVSFDFNVCYSSC